MLEPLFRKINKSKDIGRFCTEFTLDMNDVQIEIEEHGKLKFPLEEKNVKKLIKEARLAAFGLKDQTIIDTRVRNVWEIPAEKVYISSHADQTIGLALEKIKKDLGLMSNAQLSADLHNLLIYEPGQFFTSHQDTEKRDGMIGTMVIVLPNPHEGGELKITHQNKKFISSKNYQHRRVNIVAFYSDCFHEVEKVKTGNRIALTYNLYVNDGKPQAESNPSQELLFNIKEYFFESEPESSNRSAHPRWLACLLDHQYSQKGLSWSHLKGTDRAMVSELLAVAEKLDLEVHLGLTKIQEIWSAYDEYERGIYRYRRNRWRQYDEGDDQEIDTDSINLEGLLDWSCELASLVIENGERINRICYHIPGEMLFRNKENKTLKPVESNYEGYMGNYGNTMEYWYNRAVVLLWPKSKSHESFFAIAPRYSFSKLKQVLLKDRDTGKDLLEKFLPQKHLLKTDYEISDVNFILEVATLLQDEDLAQELLSVLHLEALANDNLGSAHKLFCTYGETWSIKTLKLWSSSLSFYNENLKNIEKISKKFSELPRVARWLIKQQCKIFFDDLNFHEKKTSKRELLALNKEVIKRVEQLENSAFITRDEKIALRIVSVLISLKRVLSGLDLANISFKLKGDFFKESREKLNQESIKRLEKTEVKSFDPNNRRILQKSPCQCDDCKYLELFLNSNESQLVWPLAKYRRQHIHEVIDGMCIGVKHVTRREGSPHKLVLSKSVEYFKENEAQRLASLKMLTKLRSLKV